MSQNSTPSFFFFSSSTWNYNLSATLSGGVWAIVASPAPNLNRFPRHVYLPDSILHFQIPLILMDDRTFTRSFSTFIFSNLTVDYSWCMHHHPLQCMFVLFSFSFFCSFDHTFSFLATLMISILFVSFFSFGFPMWSYAVYEFDFRLLFIFVLSVLEAVKLTWTRNRHGYNGKNLKKKNDIIEHNHMCRTLDTPFNFHQSVLRR